jgi:tetratricopeptide (TPR) repeat protein
MCRPPGPRWGRLVLGSAPARGLDRRKLFWTLLIVGVNLGPFSITANSRAWALLSSCTRGAGMGTDHSDSLLVDYYKRFLADHDLDAFRGRMLARYNEGTLERIIIHSPNPIARRGAVLALGLEGHYQTCNLVLGQALRDLDATVREMAEDALWAVWFRADSPENNLILETVRDLIGAGHLNEAITTADRLIAVAPNFAEAYNQRAIAYYLQGRLAESARDCREVIKRNPVHFAALAGLAKCQMGLNRPREALETLRQALKLQPLNEPLRETVKALEAEIEPDSAR